MVTKPSSTSAADSLALSPALARVREVGLVLAGNDRIDRWAACPALADVEQLSKMVTWMTPVSRRSGPAGGA